MRVARQVLPCLVVAAAFGLAAGLLKGDQAGFRGGIGNLSAPWLLVAFLPALRARSVAQGVLIGFLSTVTALVAFYAALTGVLAGHLGGGGHLAEFLAESQANRVYFLAGMVTGPLFGALGAWVIGRHRRVAGLVAGTLGTAEILVVAVVQGHQLLPAPFYFSWGVDDWRPYLTESAVGLAVVLVALWRNRRRATAI